MCYNICYIVTALQCNSETKCDLLEKPHVAINIHDKPKLTRYQTKKTTVDRGEI